jgi:hypothetical protein
MTIEQAIVEQVKRLPPDKQREVLNFAESLDKNGGPKRPAALKSLEGLWADLNVHVTEEDIAAARREMWGNFPRDIRP